MAAIRRTPFGAGCAASALLALAPAGAAHAKAPFQLTATYQEQDPVAEAAAGACTAAFVETIDERRSPETVGVIGKRAVLAPKDSAHWMRAVLSGLGARGVAVRFDAADAATGAVTAKFRLQTAWIAENVSTYDANVVVKLEAQGPSGGTIDQRYRGRASRGIYWGGGGSVMQNAIDGAFAKALDQIAGDLKRLCEAAPSAA